MYKEVQTATTKNTKCVYNVVYNSTAFAQLRKGMKSYVFANLVCNHRGSRAHVLRATEYSLALLHIVQSVNTTFATLVGSCNAFHVKKSV